MSKSDSPQGLVDYALAGLLGLPTLSPTVGVGSFLTIEFGATRTNSVGVSQVDFHLWVYGASWAVRQGATIFASSGDDRDGMVAGARVLDNLRMRSFDFDSKRMTLKLHFEPYELAITPLGDPDMEKWMLFLNDDTVITAGPGKAVVRERAGNN